MSGMQTALQDKWLFLFMAPPSGGKGTQTQLLSKHFGIPRIDTGAELRLMASNDCDLGRAVKQRIDHGYFVDSDVAVAVIREKLLALSTAEPDHKGYIIDGYPRNREQADKLVEMCLKLGVKVARAFYLKIPDDVILDRVVNRRICPVCAAIYSLRSKPPAKPGVCDIEGAALIQRADDAPDMVKNRLLQFEAETRPMIARFREDGSLVKLNGDRPVEQITHDLIELMKPYLEASVPQ
jgi:adenylate kinase